MKDFWRKYKMKLIIAVYAIMAVSFFYFLVMPAVDEIAGKANKIQQKKIDKEINEKKLAAVPTMEGDYNEFKDNESNLVVIMESAKEVDFIKELESLADQTGNRIEFKIQEVAAKPAAKVKGTENDIKNKLANTNYLSMQIALEGNYAGLLNFIHKLENYKNYVNIITISFEKTAAGGSYVSSNSFVASDQKEILSKEVINSILDVVVYLKK